ncbi:MAG: N-acetylmuramoyl-L-alanine amidase [Bacteroidales bacterium]
MRNIQYLVIHCTASSQNTTTLSSLNRTWKDRGWNTPGYHYLIMPNGDLITLLEENKISNGVKGYNAITINIAYVGGINAQGKAIDNRTEKQKATLFFLLENLRERYPKAEIQGHRDFSPDTNYNGIIEKKEYLKECPCFDAKQEYKNI